MVVLHRPELYSHARARTFVVGRKHAAHSREEKEHLLRALFGGLWFLERTKYAVGLRPFWGCRFFREAVVFFAGLFWFSLRRSNVFLCTVSTLQLDCFLKDLEMFSRYAFECFCEGFLFSQKLQWSCCIWQTRHLNVLLKIQNLWKTSKKSYKKHQQEHLHTQPLSRWKLLKNEFFQNLSKCYRNVLSKFLSVVFSLVFFCCLPFHPLQLSPSLLLSSSVSLRWRCPFLSQETWDEVEQKKLWTTQGQIKQNCSVKWWVSLSFFFGESALSLALLGDVDFPSFLLGGTVLSPPAFGWCCFLLLLLVVLSVSHPLPPLGGAAFSPPFGVVLLPCTSFFQVLLLAHLLVVLSSSHLPWVVLLSLLLSSLGWCCLVSSFWWSCLPPLSRRGAAVPNYILLWK